MPNARTSDGDAWLQQQQTRAELEADAWRQIRMLRALPVAPSATTPANDYHRRGSTMLKALVRFGIGAFGAYLGWLAAMDSQLGEFEVWLSSGAGFIVLIALSMVGPARGLVHVLAETARWSIMAGVVFTALWFAVNPLG